MAELGAVALRIEEQGGQQVLGRLAEVDAAARKAGTATDGLAQSTAQVERRMERGAISFRQSGRAISELAIAASLGEGSIQGLSFAAGEAGVILGESLGGPTFAAMATGIGLAVVAVGTLIGIIRKLDEEARKPSALLLEHLKDIVTTQAAGVETDRLRQKIVALRAEEAKALQGTPAERDRARPFRVIAAEIDQTQTLLAEANKKYAQLLGPETKAAPIATAEAISTLSKASLDAQQTALDAEAAKNEAAYKAGERTLTAYYARRREIARQSLDLDTAKLQEDRGVAAAKLAEPAISPNEKLKRYEDLQAIDIAIKAQADKRAQSMIELNAAQLADVRSTDAAKLAAAQGLATATEAIDKKHAEQTLALAARQRADDLLSVHALYEQRRQVETEAFDREQRTLEARQHALRAQAPGTEPERAKRQGDLDVVGAQLKALAQARADALAVSREQEATDQRSADIRDGQLRVETEQTALDAARIGIEAKVSAGKLTEAEASKAVAQAERDALPALQAALDLSEQAAAALTDPLERARALADVSVQRANLARLGIDKDAMSEMHRQAEDIGGAIAGGVSRGFSDGLKSGLREVLSGISGIFQRLLEQQITDAVFKAMAGAQHATAGAGAPSGSAGVAGAVGAMLDTGAGSTSDGAGPNATSAAQVSIIAQHVQVFGAGGGIGGGVPASIPGAGPSGGGASPQQLAEGGAADAAATSTAVKAASLSLVPLLATIGFSILGSLFERKRSSSGESAYGQSDLYSQFGGLEGAVFGAGAMDPAGALVGRMPRGPFGPNSMTALRRALTLSGDIAALREAGQNPNLSMAESLAMLEHPTGPYRVGHPPTGPTLQVVGLTSPTVTKLIATGVTTEAARGGIRIPASAVR